MTLDKAWQEWCDANVVLVTALVATGRWKEPLAGMAPGYVIERSRTRRMVPVAMAVHAEFNRQRESGR